MQISFLRFLAIALVLLLGGIIIANHAGMAAPPAAKAPSATSLKSFDPQAKALLAQMTLDEKIGQMTQPDQMFLKDPDDVERYFLGSLLNGGDSDPKTNSLQDWTDMYDRWQAHSQKTRLKIPLIYGVDAVHGHNNVLGATVFPHNIGLGCTRDPKIVEQAARVTAEEIRATGIHWTFAPCLTVPQDIRWGRTYEGFGENPDLAAKLGEAATRGFQQGDIANPLSVVACIKHFAGDGGTTWGTGLPRNGKHLLDRGDTRGDEAVLRRIHIDGYVPSIKAGAATVMPSYSSWNGVKASGNRHLLTEILKDQLGFDGFLISDYDAIDEIAGPQNYREDVEKSVNAGMDMFMVPQKYVQFITVLKQLVQEGKVSQARIDDAVTRILRVKFAMGLMDKNVRLTADRSLQARFGSPEHRRVARQAVRESLVLLKNDRKALPLSKQVKTILVAGKSADNIGNQCGGWTVKWQGESGNVTPGGTTIYQAIKQAAPGAQVTLSKDGTGASPADVAVVVVGEKPYAEMVGDTESLALAPEDVAAINNARQSAKKVVVVLISGRPLFIDDVLAKADAFVAAWLPGTEGTGVADVLFGDYKPTGKLGYSWPKATSQLPQNINMPKDKYDPLFKYGYGLSY